MSNAASAHGTAAMSADEPSLGRPRSGRAIVWCVPRSRSSILAKCMTGLPGNSVWLAHFSASEWLSSVYAEHTGKVLPDCYAGNEAVYVEAAAVMTKLKNYKPELELMGYADIQRQIEADASQYVFMKDQAYAMATENHRRFLPVGFHHAFLIREPSRVFTSVRNAMSRILRENGTYHENVSILKDDTTVHGHLALFKKQYDLWQYVRENIDPDPLVIDSYDLASHPDVVLKALCDRVGFPYDDSLLSWQPGATPWNLPTPSAEETHHAYYATALKSTHFSAPGEEGPLPRDQLTDDVIQCVDASLPYYEEMCQHKLKV
ncbi:uncharacterized protein [Diadema setosum]|uniref:uncharacterized protein n=1 Tax=Diadema setosum TaxID=31175 RepID=UPI003B3B0C52